MRLHIAVAFLSGALAQNASDVSDVLGGLTGGFGGDTMLGTNPCTYSPNTTCYPERPEFPAWVIAGRPLCCSITPDGSLCNPDGQPCTPEDGDNLEGASVCTYAPDTTCYPGYGWPLCCAVDKDLCNPDGEPCYDASILPSLDPELLAEIGSDVLGGLGGVGGLGGNATMLGTNPCTYSPNTTCYPERPEFPAWVIAGRPLCCSITPDGSLCNPDGQPCTPEDGDNLEGASVCTYAPDTTCYPGYGWPLCCAVDKDLCNPDGEPCYDASILPSLDPELLAEIGGLLEGIGPAIPSGDNMLGTNPCTYSPNTTCYPERPEFPAWVIAGRPLCCSITPDGSLCNPDGQPCTPEDGDNLEGASVCTYAPDTTCYPGYGWPLCCAVDKDLCNPDGEPCYDASILPSLDPELLAEIGGLPMLGSSYCTYSPNTTCFPSTNGFPPCCVEDPKPEGCGTGEYPECEKAEAVPPPSPASADATAEPTSSSTALVFSLAAIVGANIAACMTGMW